MRGKTYDIDFAEQNIIVICLTEACNLRCKYCYMVGKNNSRKMGIETARKVADFVLDNNKVFNKNKVIFDFIGGEPFLEVALLDEMTDYIKESIKRKGHKWEGNYKFRILTNGLNYHQPDVQRYIEKNYDKLIIGFSLDGNKKKHDMQRVLENGKGSYDLVIKNLPLWLSQFPDAYSKVTFSHDDLSLLKDSIINLWELGVKDISANIIFEDVWTKLDPIIFEEQLKDVADYIVKTGIWKKDGYNIKFFDQKFLQPIDCNELKKNYCSAGVDEFAFSVDGKIFPCIRFLDFSLKNSKGLCIGNVEDGFDEQELKKFICLNREQLDPPKCSKCSVRNGCMACLAVSYDEFSSLKGIKRTTYTCNMHKANVKATKYFYQKLAESETKEAYTKNKNAKFKAGFGGNVDMNNKFKDLAPIETINWIRNILNKLNIIVKESWQEALPISKLYSVRLEIIGTTTGTNGKGTSEEYALASAYSEFMERLSNCMLFSNWSVEGNDLFNFYPDEQQVTVEEYSRENPIFDNIIGSLTINGIKNKKINKINLIKEIYAKNNLFTSIYFEDLHSAKKYPIPCQLLRNVYGSNGMAAGNSYEEALVQAISEIFERFCLKQIVLKELNPPDIPKDLIKKMFPSIYNYISEIESLGDYSVRVKDCSLGMKLPVVCTTVFNKRTQTSLTNIGAHPNIQIALERTFTELFQGRQLDQEWNSFSDRDNIPKYNFVNLFRNSKGYFPDAFYSDDFSYPIDQSIMNIKFNSNSEMLEYYKNLCNRNDFKIFARLNNIFSFPTVHVVIPGVSEICDYDFLCYNIDVKAKSASDILANFSAYPQQEVFETLEFLDFSRKIAILDAKFSRNLKGLKNQTRDLNLYLLMINIYCKINQLNRAIAFAKEIMSLGLTEFQKNIFKCIVHLLEVKERGICSKEFLNAILSNFYDNKVVDIALEIILENKVDFPFENNNEMVSKQTKTMVVNLKKFMLQNIKNHLNE